jgi:hypothetical protein
LAKQENKNAGATNTGERRPEKGNPCMKNQNRIRRNGATKREKSQAKIANHSPAQPASVTKLLIPSQVAKEAQAAMNNFNRVGNAATAFVMMNGYKIQQSSKNNRGWESIDVEGFSNGALEFARLVSADFQTTLTNLDDFVLRVTAIIGNVETAIEKKERPEYFRLIGKIDPKQSWYRIESVVGALNNCIDLQSWALCLDGGDSAQSGAYEMSRNLQAASKSVERVTIDMLDSFCAVTSANGEAPELRRAA